MKLCRLVLLMLVAGMLSMMVGCAVNRKIAYSVKDVAPVWNESGLRDITLSIEPFEDLRRSLQDNEVLFRGGMQAGIEGQSVYINAEENYKKPPVSLQIARMIAEHENKRGAFRIVMVSSQTLADYHLVGQLKRFYGRQGYSAGAMAGAQFGLIGALATMNLKTLGTIDIEFSGLKLYSHDGNLVKDLGDIRAVYNEDLPVDAYGWSIYSNVNMKLKDVVSDLSAKVESAIAEYVKSKR